MTSYISPQQIRADRLLAGRPAPERYSLVARSNRRVFVHRLGIPDPASRAKSDPRAAPSFTIRIRYRLASPVWAADRRLRCSRPTL